MRAAPGFWWRQRPGPVALALWPLSRLWGVFAARRMRRAPEWRAPVPVVCIGNFTIGGTGKTPTALAVADLARAEGFSPGFLIRGYGGTATGPLRVDPGRHRSTDVGDEALLLAAAGPTVVGGDRVAAAKLLVATGIDLIVMDDGFQNPGLAKSLSLVLVDAQTGIGNGLMVPAGPLRAPMPVQLAATGVVVVMGEGERAANLMATAQASDIPLLRARIVSAGESWHGRRVLAFAGIGRPEKFFRSLEAAGATIEARRPFPDHHRFTEADAESLLQESYAGKLTLATTEKDHARLAGETGRRAALREAATAFPVRVAFADTDALRAMLRAAAGPHRQP